MDIRLEAIGTYTTGIFDESAAEIPAYDPETQRLFVVNANAATLDSLDLSDPNNPTLLESIDVTEFGAVANSVAIRNGVVAVAIEDANPQNPGRVVFLDTDGNLLNQVTVGSLPDMLTFTPDGTKVLVANEGEPSDDYTVDPEGSVSIIDLADGVENATVTTADFSTFNGQVDALTAAGIRIFGPNATVAQDLEPEYITVSADSSTAYVALQENNALAVVDLASGQVTDLLPLGFKDYNAPENPIDPSDEDGEINIRNVPVFGIYQPDAIAAYEVDGETYIVTANEGDARYYDAFSEEERVEDLTLDPEAFPNAAELQQPENLGRLQVTNTLGDTDGDGDFDQLYAYGGRSFSIYDSQGNLVFDSGDDFERITAELFPENFNSDNNENNSFDSRSDANGPQPEGVVVGEVNGRPYAFIGLERIGGIMVYDVSDPTSPDFVQYINTRDFSGDPEAGTAGNLAPEGLAFIPSEDSPTQNPLLAVAYEVSGSVQLFEITTPISAIQGTGHTSPFEGETVTTTGIVTAVDSNGFYLQDPVGDGDELTSDGIFVFTGDAPELNPGDEVQVRGEVEEFIPGGPDTGNLSITEIGGNPEVTVLSSDNPLPAPVLLGSDGRLPPTQVIDNDNFAEFDPEEDGIDFYEAVEGMRVTVQAPQAVGPTNRFGEIFTVTDNGEFATGLSDRGTINISPDDFNPERIQLQFDSGILPDVSAIPVDVGARLGDATGVVGYSFGNFEVNLTEAFEVVEPSALEPETTEIIGTDDRLTFASYNVLNLDPVVEDVALVDDQDEDDVDDDIGEGQFDAIAAHIANNLQTPDIVALQEIQDNNGAEITDVTAADVTLSELVTRIEALSGVSYEFLDNPFIGNETNGGQPGGNIRNAYLYNPERVSFVEGSLDTVVDPQDQQTNPDNPFFDSRLPLVATFDFNGESITLINNHFSSKGGSSPLFGQNQPSVERQEDPEVNGSLDERRAQAEAVVNYIQGILAEDPDAHISVLGDINEFEFISPLETLEEQGQLVNLTNTLPEDERYSFIFQGNSQSLDHILVSPNLANSAEFDAVHVNAEFADPASDHEPLVASVDLTPMNEETFTLQLLHAADQEAGLAAVEDAVNFSAVIEGLADDFENTLRLSSGDAYIPGPFFSASDEIYGAPGIGDILINNALGFQAVTLGNHEFDQGTDTIATLINPNPEITGPGIGEGGYQGTAFPYLSANLDFSGDENLADLVVPPGEAPQPNSIAQSVVIDVNGTPVGVVGATTPTLEDISSPGDVGVLPSDDSIEELAAIIQAQVDVLTDQGVEIIIGSFHFQQLAIEQEVAALLDDVDIVIAGGSNTLLANEDDPLREGDEAAGPYPIPVDSDGETVYLVNTDGNYRYVGQLVADFDANGVITSIGEESGAFATDDAGVDRVYGQDVNPEEVADPVVVEVTEAIGDLTLEADGNVFGLTEVFLNGTRGDVRTQETNLGSLTADANLAIAQQVDETVAVSIKNGGGIRNNIGVATIPAGGTTGDLELLPPQANPAAGKEEGEISQLDIENSLRFNNGLTLLTVTTAELEQILEHGVAETEPGATPGRFPQVGGISFSFDPTLPAIEFDEEGNVVSEGDRIRTLDLIDEQGNVIQTLVENGELVADPNQEIRLVTLDFLANGGDGYPFPTFGEDRVDLVSEDAERTGVATFAPDGSEQDALAEYLAANFPADDDPNTPAFTNEDTPPAEDTRIQLVEMAADQPSALGFGTPESDQIEAGISPGFDGSDTFVFGGGGDDLVDPLTASSSSSNRIYGGSGNDDLFASTGDRVFGGAGNDVLDAAAGSGNNRLYGGQGNDDLFAGSGDRLVGGEGDDRLFVTSGGNNVFSGLSGADQFWIANGEIPESANTVTDFTAGEDVLGIAGLGVEFADLTLTQENGSTAIALAGDELAILLGVQADSLSADNFVFAEGALG